MAVCVVDECNEQGGNRKEPPLCTKHRHRRRSGNYGKSTRGTRTRPCEFKPCDNMGHSRGLCATHYAQKYVRGHEMTPIRVPTGRYIADTGYVLIYEPERVDAPMNAWMMEHRKIMADFLGRPLEDHENVHHRNGVRHDNRIENLELWITSQPSGQRPDDLCNWATAILKKYKQDAELLSTIKRTKVRPRPSTARRAARMTA